LEDWKIGKLENWKIGRMENWKIGRMENWKRLNSALCPLRLAFCGTENWKKSYYF